MQHILVYLVAAFFAGMGLVALLQPERVLAFFGTRHLTRDGRNEVRAVYGGFGIAIAALLLCTFWLLPAERCGILLTVTVALLGMAAGRLVSMAIDGAPGRWVWVFLLVELVLAGMLLLAR